MRPPRRHTFLILSALLAASCGTGTVDVDTPNGSPTTARPDLSLPPEDRDGDGFDDTVDCNDQHAAINPLAPELCGDFLDNDCDGSADESCPDMDTPVVKPPALDMGTPDMSPPSEDRDGDLSFTPKDCNDNDPAIAPGKPEVCGDNKDNDCMGGVDDGCDTPGSPLGSPCMREGDCEGSTCFTDWPQGHCTASCAQGISCPTGATCYELSSSQGPEFFCLQDCTEHAQCRQGYVCNRFGALGSCGPKCVVDDHCAQGQVCAQDSGECVEPAPTKLAQKASATGTLSERLIDINGEVRTYQLYVPSTATPDVPRPLLLAYHGNGDSALNFYNTLQLGEWAQGSGFIVAVLDGPLREVQGGQISWDAYTAPAQNRDLAFSRDVLISVSTQFSVDAARVYALGHSQGGFFAFYLGMVEAAKVSAIATQASSAPQGGALIQSAARKTPVFMSIGAQDGLLEAARQTRDQLLGAGHAVVYEELPGVGHGGWQTIKTEPALEFLLGY